MIPFNIFGHTNVFTSQSEDPIVWVDASDISTYTLGTASDLGNELVVNGDFANDSDWNKGEGWSISGGTANRVASSSFSNLIQNLGSNFELNKTYQFTINITSLNGRLKVVFSNTNIILDTTTSGEYIINAQRVGNTTIYIQASSSGTECTIDNISVKEILN